MATASVPNTFVNGGGNADATEVNANFSSLVNFANNSTVHADGTNLQAALAGAWDTYTPTFSGAAGTFTLGNGTVGGRSRKLGRIVHFIAWHVCGSTTSKSVATADKWRCTLPYTAASTGVPWNLSCNVYESTAPTEVQGTYAYIPSGTLTVAQTEQVGHYGNVTTLTGSVVVFSGTYEAAS